MGRRHHGTSEELLERRERPFNPKDAQNALDLLDMCVRALQDTRRSKREAALTTLAGALEDLPPLHELDRRCFNIFALCGICIKDNKEEGSGSLKEACLAFRAVGLLALTLGDAASSSWILAQSFPLLSRTLQEQVDAPAPTLAAAALDCLAAVTFAGAQGKEDVARSMKAVWDLIFPSSPVVSSRSSSKMISGQSTQVLSAAVPTWAFLLTTVVSMTDVLRKADSAAWNAPVSSLISLLDHDYRAVRMAAGEALAVCVELNLTRHYAPRKDMDALAARVSELASEYTAAVKKGTDNAMLLEERDLFRRVAAFLDRNERLQASLPASADTCIVALRVSSWAKLVQLNFLKRFLGNNGFVKHVQGNELFVEAFSYGADEGKVLSIARRKKQSSSKTEDMDLKKRTRYRTWDWNIFCNYPYTAQYKPEALLQIGWHKH